MMQRVRSCNVPTAHSTCSRIRITLSFLSEDKDSILFYLTFKEAIHIGIHPDKIY